MEHKETSQAQKELRLQINDALTLSRAQFMNQFASTFGDKRNYYTTLGYPTNNAITFQMYYDAWRREGMAKRIVKAYPEATWRGKPTLTVLGKADANSPLKKKWEMLAKRTRVFHYLQLADILSGIGRYGVLFIGFNDGKDLNTEVKPSKTLDVAYFSAFHENSVQIKELENDIHSPRFGMPKMYKIKMLNATEGITGGTIDREVHWSRVVHIAEGKEENEWEGTSRLEPVYNNLINLLKISGGDAEMFWLGAYSGVVGEVDKDTEIDDTETLNAEMEAYVHKLSRFLVVQGMKIKTLSPAIAQVWEHIKAQLTLISGTTGIPQRILTGSERGELASIMDENNWNTRVEERRNDFAEGEVLIPLIQRLILLGVLPNEEYEINWPSLEFNDDKRESEVIANLTKALAEYVSNQVYLVMPLEMYLRSVWKFTDAVIEEMKAAEPEVFEDEDLLASRDELLTKGTTDVQPTDSEPDEEDVDDEDE